MLISGKRIHRRITSRSDIFYIKVHLLTFCHHKFPHIFSSIDPVFLAILTITIFCTIAIPTLLRNVRFFISLSPIHSIDHSMLFPKNQNIKMGITKNPFSLVSQKSTGIHSDNKRSAGLKLLPSCLNCGNHRIYPDSYLIPISSRIIFG